MSSARERYLAAQHGMQSGVALALGVHADRARELGDASPKHLRVGVNTAMVDQGALVGLLIAKGVITLEEYETALADAMEREVKTYEREASERLVTDVRLA